MVNKVQEGLQKVDIERTKYSGHSFRIEAATTAVPNTDCGQMGECGISALHARDKQDKREYHMPNFPPSLFIS